MLIKCHDDNYEEQQVIGQGAYGQVFKCLQTSTNDAFAVKELKVQSTGFPSVIECAIQSTFHHPFLQTMIDRHVGDSIVHVIQPLGTTDAYVYACNHPPLIDSNPELVFRWTHQMLQATACLHRYGIVHGDIKPSNVLIMPDDSIRLADFTLSAQELWPGQTFRHIAYTITHRAPEVLLAAFKKTTWGKPADIWGLGCTIFEIGYKTSPFKYQGNNNSVENVA